MRAYLFALTAIVALVLASSQAFAGGKAHFGVNLIANPGAESGAGLPNKGPIPGWSTSGGAIAVQYGFDGYPSLTDPGPPDRGKNFFSGGTNSPRSSASQNVDVSALAAFIDRGSVQWVFSAYIGGYAGQADYATVTALFLDCAGFQIGGTQLGPVTVAARGAHTGLLYRTTHGVLPPHTRRIRVTMVMTRFEGASNDGYVDNIVLKLSKK